MGVKYPMCVRCQIQIEVEQVGALFRTTEECPAGHRAGMEPMDLMDLCVSCPKAEPQVLAGVVEERFLSKKAKHPVPKKK